MLVVMCVHCENPLIVDKLDELRFLINDKFTCPDCEKVNQIPEDLREYIVETV